MKDNPKLRDGRDRAKINLSQDYERSYAKIKKVESKEASYLAEEFSRAKKVVVLETTHGIYALPYSRYLRLKDRLKHVKKIYVVDLENSLKVNVSEITESLRKAPLFKAPQINLPQLNIIAHNSNYITLQAKKTSVLTKLAWRGVNVDEKIVEDFVLKYPNKSAAEIANMIQEKYSKLSKLTKEKAIEYAKQLYKLYKTNINKFYKKVKEEENKILSE
ncbi:MAG: hypothetical protein QXS63_04350 [Zestosphaera sp.]